MAGGIFPDVADSQTCRRSAITEPGRVLRTIPKWFNLLTASIFKNESRVKSKCEMIAVIVYKKNTGSKREGTEISKVRMTLGADKMKRSNCCDQMSGFRGLL